MDDFISSCNWDMIGPEDVSILQRISFKLSQREGTKIQCSPLALKAIDKMIDSGGRRSEHMENWQEFLIAWFLENLDVVYDDEDEDTSVFQKMDITFLKLVHLLIPDDELTTGLSAEIIGQLTQQVVQAIQTEPENPSIEGQKHSVKRKILLLIIKKLKNEKYKDLMDPDLRIELIDIYTRTFSYDGQLIEGCVVTSAVNANEVQADLLDCIDKAKRHKTDRVNEMNTKKMKLDYAEEKVEGDIHDEQGEDTVDMKTVSDDSESDSSDSGSRCSLDNFEEEEEEEEEKEGQDEEVNG